MKASILVERLQYLIDEFGDKEVIVYDGKMTLDITRTDIYRNDDDEIESIDIFTS